jgi:hypothetical protein
MEKQTQSTILLCLSLVLGLSLWTGAAEGKHELLGIILNRQHQPLAFVTVLLLDADTNFIAGTTSDHKGTFSFQEESSMTGFLRVSSPRYTDTTISIMQNMHCPVIIVLQAATHNIKQRSGMGHNQILHQRLDRLMLNLRAIYASSAISVLQFWVRCPESWSTKILALLIYTRNISYCSGLIRGSLECLY